MGCLWVVGFEVVVGVVVVVVVLVVLVVAVVAVVVMSWGPAIGGLPISPSYEVR